MATQIIEANIDNTATGLVIKSSRLLDTLDYDPSVLNWEVDAFQLEKGHTSIVLSEYLANDFRLLDCYFEKKTLQRSKNLRSSLCFVLPEESEIGITIEGMRCSSNVLTCLPQHAEINLVTESNTRTYSIDLPLQLIEELTNNCLSENDQFVIPTSARLYLLENNKAHELREKLKLVMSLLLTEPNANAMSLIRRLLHESIAPILFQTTMKKPCLLNKAKRSDKLFNLAISYIDENLNSAPTVSTLATKLNTSMRHLQMLFSERVGFSPKAYLKIRQLEQIRRELKAKQHYRGLVSKTAHEYGFWHLGQFSKDFKNQFGCLPTDLRS